MFSLTWALTIYRTREHTHSLGYPTLFIHLWLNKVSIKPTKICTSWYELFCYFFAQYNFTRPTPRTVLDTLRGKIAKTSKAAKDWPTWRKKYASTCTYIFFKLNASKIASFSFLKKTQVYVMKPMWHLFKNLDFQVQL